MARIAGMAVFLGLASSSATRAESGCAAAITTAQQANGDLPAHILHAIGVVESGRRDPLTGEFGAWPWSVNAAGDSRMFGTSGEAIAFVRDAQAHGIRSIDVGCMQINLLFHPNAFASLEDAFAPEANVRYATSFLLDLRQRAGDWLTATGNYHSATPELSRDYARRVQAVLSGEQVPAAWPELGSQRSPPGLSQVAMRRPRVIEPGSDPGRQSVLVQAYMLPHVYHPGG